MMYSSHANLRVKFLMEIVNYLSLYYTELIAEQELYRENRKDRTGICTSEHISAIVQ
jgi:hypothetical protein